MEHLLRGLSPRLPKLLRRVYEVNPHLYEHGLRVARYGAVLAVAHGVDPVMRSHIFAAGLLHDVAESIVLPSGGAHRRRHGGLWQRHVTLGADIAIAAGLPLPVSDAIRHHHEWFDGSGFPEQLPGAVIPRTARFLTVADTFASLVEGSPFSPTYSIPEALHAMSKLVGTMLDPEVAEPFLALPPAFLSTIRFMPLELPHGGPPTSQATGETVGRGSISTRHRQGEAGRSENSLH